MERNYEEEPGYKAARKRVKDIKGFYVHLVVYLAVNIILFLVNTGIPRFGNSNLEMSTFYTPLFWGIGLVAHWVSVFGPGFLLGKKWEERKIKELMEKDRKQMQKWE